MDLLQNTLCFPTNPEQLQVLCTAILREMSPFDDLALSCDHTQNTRQLSLVASVLLAQVTQLPPIHLVNLKSKGTNLDSELGHLWGKIRMDKVSGIPENKSLNKR